MLWDFCTEGNVKMVEYLLTLPGIYDAEMDDGTTAFAMALAKRDLELIKLFMASNIPSHIAPLKLARRALTELDRTLKKDHSALRGELRNGLERHNIPLGEETSERGKLSLQ